MKKVARALCASRSLGIRGIATAPNSPRESALGFCEWTVPIQSEIASKSKERQQEIRARCAMPGWVSASLDVGADPFSAPVSPEPLLRSYGMTIRPVQEALKKVVNRRTRSGGGRATNADGAACSAEEPS